eukprot:TRINITY_DN621_c0_g1_i1.p1 TRINITY_DN621_c0_g1~~TRINITY_DN621_c0_g1_i1.p1  ORF type:complete len:251 (-),score=18.06 TRINITY_DN621_c0_g1_i1:1021-1773(-)
MQPCMSSQIFLSRQQALLLVVLLTIYLNFSWAICIGGPHASRGGGGGNKEWDVTGGVVFGVILLVVLTPFGCVCVRNVCALCARHRRVLKIQPEVLNMKTKVLGSSYRNIGLTSSTLTYTGFYSERGYSKSTTYTLTFSTSNTVYGVCTDADGLAHIQGYYQVEDGQFWAEWVESPLDLPVDPESQELDQERLKKVIRKAPFFTLSRLHGNVNGAYLLPYNIEGEYEATTGIKGSIKISSQGGQPSSQVL